jgi:tetratricopeptide (TPR) repeat protein
MEYTLKTISKDGIPEAISKIELYRYLNEPEEAESICRDILAADPANQLATRLLGLTLTDQFDGRNSDRYAEAEKVFQSLTDPYELLYYRGLLQERHGKALAKAGAPSEVLAEYLNDAMRSFEEAEKIRPARNDDAMLRWNRCVRLLEKLDRAPVEESPSVFEGHDTAPIEIRSRVGARAAR